MTSATIIRKFNALHKKVVSKQFVKSFLDDVNEFIRLKRIDSHGPEGEKIINIKQRLTTLLPLVNGTDFRLLIDPKVRITPDLTPLKNKIATYEKKRKFEHKKRGKKLSGTYDQYVVAKEKFEKSLNELTDKLNKFPKHPNGLVKERTPEYIAVKKEYDKIFSLYRSFNSLPQNKKYSKQFFEAKRKKQLAKSKRKTFKHKSRGKKKVVVEKYEPTKSLWVRYGGSNRKMDKHKIILKKHFPEFRDTGSVGKGHWSNRTATINDTPENHKILETLKKDGIRIDRNMMNVAKGLSGKKPDKYPSRNKPKKKRVERLAAIQKLTPVVETTTESKNLSGVEYNYKEIDLGEFKKDLHKMFSDTIIQIHGLPGHGKTVYVLKIAQDRASRTGDHVLYVAHEEFGRSTLDLKLKEQKIGHKNLRIRGELTDADAKWATVIILDSVNSLDLTSKGVKKLTEKFPNKNWILILQSTKDGKFRGDQTWEHLVDIAGEVRDRKLILSKNRLDPDNKDKMAKLRMDSLISEKTEAMRIREKVKYEATKDKIL